MQPSRRARRLALGTCWAVPVLAMACRGSAPTPPATAPANAAAASGAASQEVTRGAPKGGAGPVSSVDESALDRSVKPCDDFYRFACGGWQKATKIPDDEARWIRSFSVISESNERKLRELLEGYARGEGASDPYARALGDFYATCMDEAAIEKAGTEPLAAQMATIDALKDARSLAAAFGDLAAMGVDAPVGLGSWQDLKSSQDVVANVAQAGLGLPDRDYYLSEDGKKRELRGKYEAHVARMFELLGEKAAAAKKSAAAVMRIETALARASTKREDLRDPKRIYNRVERAGLKKLSPAVDWDAYLSAAGAGDVTTINVTSPDFVKALGPLTRAVPLSDWKAYLRWHTVDAFTDQLPSRFIEEDFEMARALSGAAKVADRWKRCVRSVDDAMGEALGQGFVKATLGSEGKEAVRAIVRSIEGAMERSLHACKWMDDATRGRALEKLGAIGNKVAFPDRWRDYSRLVIGRGSYLENVARARRFEQARDLGKVGKPVDPTEWGMSPPTVNAYYSLQRNEMVFPAGILQLPFYGNTQALPTSYGAIGMVMGHELTHGFDDQGRKFDAKGNLSNWWSAPAQGEFERRAACVERQYSEYEVGGEHVNGKLTLGENIADLGGVKLAYAAMKEAAARAGFTRLGEYTADQLFFLGHAQSWCSIERDEAARVLLTTDPHAPSRFRIIGPLSNMKEFADAFQCKPGDRMVRGDKDRCDVW